MLSIERLCVSAGGCTLVDDVSFTVGSGERVGIVGGSGSGKSLTAAAIVGHRAPGLNYAGRIRIGGVDVLGTPAARRRMNARAAVVFQDSATSLNPMVTVRNHLSKATSGDVENLLRTVGFTDPTGIGDRHPGELSGGQRQRVCVALAMAGNRSILVADEPTTALDGVTRAIVLDALRAVGGGLVFITHDAAAAATICDRLIVMGSGRVVESASTPQLMAHPKSPAAVALVEAARRADLTRLLARRSCR